VRSRGAAGERRQGEMAANMFLSQVPLRAERSARVERRGVGERLGEGEWAMGRVGEWLK